MGGPRRNIAITFITGKPEWCGYLAVQKSRIRSAVLTEYRRVTDRRTDGQTSYDSIVRAMHTRRAVKTAGESVPR